MTFYHFLFTIFRKKRKSCSDAASVLDEFQEDQAMSNLLDPEGSILSPGEFDMKKADMLHKRTNLLVNQNFPPLVEESILHGELHPALWPASYMVNRKIHIFCLLLVFFQANKQTIPCLKQSICITDLFL